METRSEDGFYRLLAESSPDLIVVLDSEGTVRYANPSLHRMLGYQPQEILGRRDLPFLAREEAAEVSGALLAAAEGGSERIEFRARHADGSFRRLEALCAHVPLGDASGWVLVGARDVTEGREAQDFLGKIAAVFLNLGADPIENMRWLLRAGKEALGTDLSLYCRMHRGILQVLSASPEDEGLELGPETRGTICHDVIMDQVENPLVLGDLRGTEYEGGDIFASRHGLRSCAAHPVTLGNRVVGCMCAYYRETKEFSPQELAVMGLGAKAVSIEEERLAYHDSLKDLTDIVSHELRHPITILSGYASFLEESWQSLEESKRREILGIISSSVDRLDDLVNELLDASRIEKGLFSLYEQDGVEITPLLEQAIEEMRARGAQNEFVVSAADGRIPVRADPERMKQLLIILLDNAVKYSPKGSPIEILCKTERGRPVVSVLDRGPGVKSEERQRIFEPFFQSERASNHSRSGIGLGLYIAREIVEAHGGKIWYEHREGGGSCLRFSLP